MIEARAVDRRLHGLVTAAARNPHLTSLGAHLTAAATLGFGAEPYAPEFLAQARAEHEELVEHIAARRRRRGGPVRRGALRAHARVDARQPAQGQGRSPPLTTRARRPQPERAGAAVDSRTTSSGWNTTWRCAGASPDKTLVSIWAAVEPIA